MKNVHVLQENIYITSNEEIKDGDWFLTDDKRVEKCAPDWRAREWHKKIILTTDPSLAPDVQKIDDEFLEWFVNNPSCEYVGVDKNWNYPLDKRWQYKIIIPKEEPKKVLTEEDIWSKEDIDAVTEYINKETLKEASKRYSANELSQLGFINSAKWQQGRSYSEEDMIAFGEFIFKHTLLAHSKGVKNLFEQFKKK